VLLGTKRRGMPITAEGLTQQTERRQKNGRRWVAVASGILGLLVVSLIAITSFRPFQFHLGGRRWICIGRTLVEDWPPPGAHYASVDAPYNRTWAFRTGDFCYSIVVFDEYR